MDRFWNKVDKSGDCWEWTARTDKDGYGLFKLNGKSVVAHRFSMLLSGVEIPDALCVLHTCDNRICVNPNHLWIGSRGDNNTDRNHKNRSWSKLCEVDVHLIRELAKTQTQTAIARWLDVHRLTVGRIVNRKTWAHIQD